jgi:hypothetical protein
MGEPFTELWRTEPPTSPAGTGSDIRESQVFPSGRQAIRQAMAQAGLTRADRIAVPEWSSHCVWSAVSWQATPLPMAEAVAHNLPVRAVLIYEQWGWPLPQRSWEALQRRYPGAFLLWDRVDSADFFTDLRRKPLPMFKDIVEITSLSKLLGLAGGGLLRKNNQYAEFVPPTGPTPPPPASECLESFAVQERFKNEGAALHPQAREWLRANSLFDAAGSEHRARTDNARAVSRRRAASGWPDWMQEAVEQGVSPGIVPLLRGRNSEALEDAARLLERDHSIRAKVYHFNWAGNAAEPRFEPCLAFPNHGQATGFPSALDALDRL